MYFINLISLFNVIHLLNYYFLNFYLLMMIIIKGFDYLLKRQGSFETNSP